MSKLATDEIRAIRARLEAATPGEWKWGWPSSGADGGPLCLWSMTARRAVIRLEHGGCLADDTALIATAPTDIAALLAHVEAVEQERDNAAASLHYIENRDADVMRDLWSQIDRLRADLEIVAPPELPAEVFTAPDGPPVPCEVCCAPIEPGSPVASWVDGDRQVVAHAGRCPEPEMWCVEWMARSAPNLWLRAHYGVKRRLPYEEARGEALKVASEPHTARVRLVRARAVRP